MPHGKHILHSFDEILESLRGNVLMMASLTARNLGHAMSCLLDRDAQQCAITIADEDEMDALEKKVDQDGIEVLLRFQPVASDLRQVVSTMKVGSNIERVGDQAVKIARRARSLNQKPELAEARTLRRMFEEAIALFDDSVQAYDRGDVAAARLLRDRDRRIDQLNHDLANAFTSAMASHPDRIPDFMNLIFIARHLERVGDHANNIGEDAVYATDADDIRHAENAFAL